VQNSARVVGRTAAAGLNHQFLLGAEGDPFGGDADLELGQQVDVVLERFQVDVAGSRD